MLSSTTHSFGALLKQLRKRAGMTQRDLAAALNYSDSLISSLEKAQRQPDLDAVITRFIPALGLQDDPVIASLLIERAAAARGERPPASVTLERAIGTGTYKERDTPAEQLPSPPSDLIGRAEVIHQLCNRLLGHSGRLLTLVGPPGIGKTRLALALAAHLRHLYPDGAVFVPLASISDPTLMAPTIAVAVRSDDTTSTPPSISLIGFLRSKQLLLVLDNCEQIVGARPLIAEIVAACPGVCVLATSRERLHLRAEQRYRVPPLDMASAVELFAQRAAAVDADFTITAANEALCRRLDRLPLALELCAGQVDMHSPSQLLAHLRARPLDLLVAGAHDLPPQHRTLRNAIQHSYDLLADDERVLFRRLGIFVGGWSLAMAEAVCVWGPEAESSMLWSTLHALIGKSLVRAETIQSGDQRFFMLETIRDFALEQLRAQGEEDLLRERHYTACLNFFRTADSHLRGPEAASWLVRTEPEQDNLRAALQWAIDGGRYADAAWLVLAASWCWLMHEHHYESARWIQRLLSYRHTLDPDLRVAVMLWFYAFASGLEGFQPVDSYTGEIMQLLEGCSHPILHAAAWHWIAATTPDSSQAAVASERCIALAREATNAPGPGSQFGLLADHNFILAANLENYAARLIDQGEFVRATTLSVESLKLFKAQEHHQGIAGCLGILGRLAFLQGDLVQARNFFQEVLRLVAFKSPAGLCSWWVLLGIVTLYSGDPLEARRLLTESLRIALDLKNAMLLARTCIYLTETSLWEGELAQAERWLAQSLAHHADSHRITIDQIQLLFVAARLATAQRDYLRAAMLFGLADQVSSRIHYIPAGPMRSLIDAALATVRAALVPNAFADAFTAGQQLSLEAAFATILHPTTVAAER